MKKFFKKLGKFYKKHRVFTILMAVVIVCVILIATVLFRLFYDSKKGKYGDRLEGIEKVQLTDKHLDDVESKILAEKNVLVAECRVQGKIVYIHINFSEAESLVEAKGTAQKALENFTDEEKGFYDFHFTLKKSSTETQEGFVISGAKNKNGSGLVWNNNNPVTVDLNAEKVETEPAGQ